MGTRSNASNRVNRGGSWNNNARNCRSANRNWNTPDNRNNNLGFRFLLSSAIENRVKSRRTDLFPVPRVVEGKSATAAPRW
ncbi:MAG: SUMF1/EgtB/PvdO family nonheme iron enzyme [Thermoguttaceae bacterium]|nr:SUMF1/EgtB/PvdO family nonheme iron enzyme [Thermoguttaceae bacterium]